MPLLAAFRHILPPYIRLTYKNHLKSLLPTPPPTIGASSEKYLNEDRRATPRGGIETFSPAWPRIDTMWVSTRPAIERTARGA